MTLPTRRDHGLLVLLLVVGMAGLGAAQDPSRANKVLHLSKTEARERARLEFELEEAKTRAAQAENQLADLQEERVRLLEHMKPLLLERTKTRAEIERLREDLGTVTDTLAQVTEQADRWKTEAEQRRGEASELQQQLALVPPEPPTARKLRTTYEGELREARKDAEYLWSKEREKFERRHAAELQEAQGKLAKASTQLATLTEDLRQVTQQARDTEQRLLKEKTDQVGRAQRELDQIRRRASQEEQQHQQAVAQLHEQMDKAAAELKRRLGFERLAVRRAREDARRQINHAEQKARHERVGLEQLRSGVVVDWAKLYVRVGVLEAQLGHTEEAERDFKSAVQLQPTLATAYYNLGILYDDHLNNGPAAIAAYEQYLLLAPAAKDAKTVRGWIQLLKGTEIANQDRAQWNRPGLDGLAKTFKELWG